MWHVTLGNDSAGEIVWFNGAPGSGQAYSLVCQYVLCGVSINRDNSDAGKGLQDILLCVLFTANCSAHSMETLSIQDRQRCSPESHDQLRWLQGC
jgi:hypothetical protein